MADRYWVGGAGTWNSSNTANWSTSSGGAGGASVPTSADNAIFDANSKTTPGAYTVTMSGINLVCLDLDASASISLTFAGSGPTLSIYGNFALSATNVVSATANDFVFRSTSTGRTVNTNGVSLATGTNITFNGVGGGWTFASAIVCRVCTLTNGSLNTGNFNLTCTAFQSNNNNTRSLTLGSSVIVVQSGDWNVSTATGMTLNSGTSQIQMQGSNCTFWSASALTWYDVLLTSSCALSGGFTLSGNFVGRNFQIQPFAADSATTFRNFSFGSGQTITVTGTFGTTGAGPSRRVRNILNIATGAINISNPFTVSAGAFQFDDCTIGNMICTGAGIPATGTSIGNMGGCSNITFTAAKTVYLVGGTATWQAAGWATSSGGGASTANFPLTQDAVIVDNSSGASGMTLTMMGPSNYNSQWGMLDLSLRTVSMAIAWNGVTATIGGLNGGYKHGTGLTYSGTPTLVFVGTGTAQFAPSPSTTVNWNTTVTMRENPATDKVVLQNNLISTATSTTLRLNAGTFDLNGFTITAGMSLVISGRVADVKRLDYNGGAININASSSFTNNVINYSEATNYTYTGSGLITYQGTGSANLIALTGGSALPTESGAHPITVTANYAGRTFNVGNGVAGNLDLSALTATSLGTSGMIVYGNLTLPPTSTVASTTAGSYSMRPSSGTKIVTCNGQIGAATLTANGTGGTVQLFDNWMAAGATGEFRLYGGGLNLNGKIVYCNKYDTSSSTARTLTCGVGSQIRIGGNGGTVFDSLTTTNLTCADQLNYNVYLTYTGSTGTRNVYGPSGATDPTIVVPNLYIVGGSDTISYISPYFQIIDLTGFTGTHASEFYCGNFVQAGASLPANPVWTMSGTSGRTYDVTATSFPGSITTSSNTALGATFRLNGNLTLAQALSIEGGTLALNGFNITCATLALTGTAARSISFTGSSKVVVTGNAATVFNFGVPTNFTTTGTTRVEFTYLGSTGTRTFTGIATNSNANGTNKIQLYILGGSDLISMTNTMNGGVDFGAYSGTMSNQNRYFENGNTVFNSSMVYGTGWTGLLASPGETATVTNGGRIYTNIVYFGETGKNGIVSMQDAFTHNFASLGAVYIDFGTTVRTNGYTWSLAGAFRCGTYSQAATFEQGASLFTSSYSSLTQPVAVFSVAGSNWTWSAGAKLKLTSAAGTTRQVNITNNTFILPPIETDNANTVLSFGGTGHGIQSITNTAQPQDIKFASSGTFYLQSFGFNGTAGNLISISSTGGATHTLSLPNATNYVGNYLSVYRSNATGAGTAYAVNSTNVGSNTGWVFGSPPVAQQGGMFMLFNWA
jgi:hypothetical protein